MHPNGASKNNDDQAMFSKDGPNLKSPALTNNPSVTPKTYKLKKSKKVESPILVLKLQTKVMLK